MVNDHVWYLNALLSRGRIELRKKWLTYRVRLPKWFHTEVNFSDYMINKHWDLKRKEYIFGTHWAFLHSLVKNLPTNEGDLGDVGSIPGWEDALEEGMATYSSTLV